MLRTGRIIFDSDPEIEERMPPLVAPDTIPEPGEIVAEPAREPDGQRPWCARDASEELVLW